LVYVFTIEYLIDKCWYIGHIREIPTVFSQGGTLGELEENIRDAYKMMKKFRKISSFYIF